MLRKAWRRLLSDRSAHATAQRSITFTNACGILILFTERSSIVLNGTNTLRYVKRRRRVMNDRDREQDIYFPICKLPGLGCSAAEWKTIGQMQSTPSRRWQLESMTNTARMQRDELA